MSRLDTRRDVRAVGFLTAQPWRWVPFGLRMRWARVRVWAGRRRLVRRGLALAAVVSILLLAVTATTSARELQSRWGATMEVAVVIEERNVGDVVGHGDVEFRTLPVAALPLDVIDSATTSLGAPAANQLRVGDVLRRRDLAGSDLSEVPPGYRGIAITAGPGAPTFVLGDRADVFVFRGSFGPPRDDHGQVVTGRVIEVADDTVIVAVPKESAQQVVAGLVNGAVVLAAAGP